MKLFDIVSYKNLLDTLSSRPEAQEFLNKTLGMIHTVDASNVQITGAVDQLKQAYKQISQSVEQFEKQFFQLKQAVQNLIEQHEPEYFQNSMELYNTSYLDEISKLGLDVWELYDAETNRPVTQVRACHEREARRLAMIGHQQLASTNPDQFQIRKVDTSPRSYIQNKNRAVDPKTLSLIQQRLRLYSKCHHPGMIIRPAHDCFIEDLVACDPMYFVDTDNQLLELTKSWFTLQYQQRLCRYVLDEYTKQSLFINLPVDQFGLIYAFCFFEYRPWPILQQYLKECFGLLRPGGILAFTYNNCDFANRLNSGCYTPGRLVREYTLELGYETVFDFDDDTGTSWMELRRPGNYTSIRGGQTLAAILQRSNV